jgi:hypothetical protein
MRRSKGPGNFRNFFIHIPRQARWREDHPHRRSGGQGRLHRDQGHDRARTCWPPTARAAPVALGIVPKNTGGF